jgi:hypothetical protein
MMLRATSFPLPVLAERAVQQAIVKPVDIKNHKELVPALWLYPFLLHFLFFHRVSINKYKK